MWISARFTCRHWGFSFGGGGYFWLLFKWVEKDLKISSWNELTKCQKRMENCIFPSLEEAKEKHAFDQDSWCIFNQDSLAFSRQLITKDERKKQMTFFIVIIISVSFLHHSATSCSIFLYWRCDVLVHARPAQIQAKSSVSTRNQTDTDLSGCLVRVKPGLTISTVSHGCDSCQHAGTQMH